MSTILVIPAQIRAGRTLLDWPQEQLANKAKIALGSLQDIESQQRPLEETGVIRTICQIFEEEGICFTPVDNEKGFGLGVCLAANLPNQIVDRILNAKDNQQRVQNTNARHQQ